MCERIYELNLIFLNTNQKEWLNRSFSLEEIKDAAFQIGPLKALGVDGKPGIFYQRFWHIVGSLTTASFITFLNLGYLFKELNKTLISLIPEIDYPRNVSHYKHISIYNVSYKIISKVLVNQLRPIMNEIIVPFKNAFVKGRLISNNIIVGREIINTIKKGKDSSEL